MFDSTINNNDILNIIEKNKIFGIIRTDDEQKTIDIAKALLEGGIKVQEISMNNIKKGACAIEKICAIEGISTAAGSIITSEQADIAIKAGARLIVSPVTEPRLIKLCKDKKIPIIASVSTPNEAYEAWKLGVSIIKVFPAKALGGPSYLNNILKQMPFLNLVPTGEIEADNFTEYLKAGAIAVGMGNTFYAKRENSSEIIQKAKLSISKLNKYLENEENKKTKRN